LLTDLGGGNCYLLDLFHVRGGRRHDYSLHGFNADFSVAGLDLSPPARGTLAGEEVEYGAAYDDPDLDRLPRTRSFYTYRGSGYSYLTDVQRGTPSGVWTAAWKDGEVGLCVHVLPESVDEVLVATGRPPEKGSNPEALKYVLLRHEGDPLASSFVTVLEPFRGAPVIREVVDLGSVSSSDAGQGLGLRVEHTAGSDTWLIFPATDEEDYVRLRRVGRDAAGQVVRLDVIGCGQVSADNPPGQLTLTRGLSGCVVAVRDADHAVEVELDGVGDGTIVPDYKPAVGLARRPAPTVSDCQRLVGETALLGNARHGTSYTITGVREENGRLVVTFGPESFRLGRFRVGTVAPDGRSLATPTYLYLAAQGYYRGTRLVDAAQQLWLEVDDVTLSPHQPGQRREGRITLREPFVVSHESGVVADGGLAQRPAPTVPDYKRDLAERLGEVAFLYDFGPGDRFTVLPHAHALRQPDGTWAVSGCGQWEMG
jgi:hypothetical protein